MSNNNWSSEPTMPKLEKLELKNTVDLYIPEDVRRKIQYLCLHNIKDEWSGVLFYTVEGSIKNPNDFKITLRDIFLMDIGNGTYTSFNWDETIVEYRMDNPESIDWTIGHIHSHNIMSVFFSPTDWSELNDNCKQHNYYLSVIINNYMDVQAKIAFTADLQKFSSKDENGKDYNLKLTSLTIEPYMFVYNCNILNDNFNIPVPDQFSERLEIIKKQKIELAEKNKLSTVNNPIVNGSNNNSKISNGSNWGIDRWGAESAKTPDYDPSNKAHNTGNKNSSIDKYVNKNSKRNRQRDYTSLSEFENLMDSNREATSIEEEFACYILRLGNEIVLDNIEEALNDIEIANLNSDSLSQSIEDSYGPLYDSFFEKLKKYQGNKAFISTTEVILNIYEENEHIFEFLTPIVSRLRQVLARFEHTIEQEALKEKLHYENQDTTQ